MLGAIVSNPFKCQIFCFSFNKSNYFCLKYENIFDSLLKTMERERDRDTHEIVGKQGKGERGKIIIGFL